MTIAAPAHPALGPLVTRVAEATAGETASVRARSDAVADVLREFDPRTFADLDLPARGHARTLLHADDAFSIVGLVWQPGATTRVHDHLAWCVVGVVSGVEHEVTYRIEDDGLHVTGTDDNQPGTVTALAPPGDIHHVANPRDEVAVTLNVYGVDLRRHDGSSVRRWYDLPVAVAG